MFPLSIHNLRVTAPLPTEGLGVEGGADGEGACCACLLQPRRCGGAAEGRGRIPEERFGPEGVGAAGGVAKTRAKGEDSGLGVAATEGRQSWLLCVWKILKL